jgi:hypothetical protein
MKLLKSYALLNPDKTIRIISTQDAEPQEDFVELIDWDKKIPESSNKNFSLVVVNGKLEWKDLRDDPKKKLDAWLETKEKRTDKEYDKFLFKGKYYQCDLNSQLRLHNLILLVLLKEEIDYMPVTTIDNESVLLSRNEFKQLGIVLAEHVLNTHLESQLKRIEIENGNY